MRRDWAFVDLVCIFHVMNYFLIMKTFVILLAYYVLFPSFFGNFAALLNHSILPNNGIRY